MITAKEKMRQSANQGNDEGTRRLVVLYALASSPAMGPRKVGHEAAQDARTRWRIDRSEE